LKAASHVSKSGYHEDEGRIKKQYI